MTYAEDYETANSEKETKIFNISDKVNVWSDFLRPHLHPKAIFLLEDVLHPEICNETFDGRTFLDGISIFQKERTEEEVMDRIRLLAESCGSLQVRRELLSNDAMFFLFNSRFI